MKLFNRSFDAKEFVKNNKYTCLAFTVILFGIIVRVIEFGNLPCGLNQDEAYAGYEALSLANYGKDSSGYSFPCYFVSWGSGMNVLESYLAIPFVKLFGLSVVTFRLPQLICACISMPVFYLLLKEIFYEKTALAGLFVCAVSPWHIMLSRWGLESNLAPAFLLFGFYFLIKGLKKNYLLIFSAIMYGLSLYAYAITWAVVPLTIISCGIYILASRTKVSVKYLMISVCVLFLLALPLILFVFVNNGVIGEIKTPLLSVPKLTVMRASELSLENLLRPEIYQNFINVIFKQYDGLPWNSTEEFGLFYKLSLPFAVIGICRVCGLAWEKLRKKIFSCELLCIIAALCSVLCCLMVSNLNVNRANMLHFFTLIFIAAGISEACSWFKKGQYFKHAVVLGYAICFMCFVVYYFGSYNDTIGWYFKDGVGETVTYLNSVGCDDICVDSSVYHSQILFYDETPVYEYLETVEYSDRNAAYRNAERFGKYTFGIDYYNLDAHDAYIVPADQTENFSSEEYEVSVFGNYAAVCRING